MPKLAFFREKGLLILSFLLFFLPNVTNLLLLKSWFPIGINHFQVMVGDLAGIYEVTYVLRFFALIYLFSLLKNWKKWKYLFDVCLVSLIIVFVITPILYLWLSANFTGQIKGYEIFRSLNLLYMIISNTTSLLFLNILVPCLIFLNSFKRKKVLSIVVFFSSLATIHFYSFNIERFSPHLISYLVGTLNVLLLFYLNGVFSTNKLEC